MNSIERRRARAAHREQLKRQEQQLKKRTITLFAALAAVVLLVVLVVFVVLAVSNCAANSSGAGSIEASTGEGDNAAMDIEALRQETRELLPQYYYYEESRSERYLDYYLAHLDMPLDEVIVRVDLGLDTEPYVVSAPINDPDSLLVLVTKHYFLPYDYEPTDLVNVGDILIRSAAANPLEQLIADAAADGVSLSPSSGYRDASYQEALYNGYSDSLGTDWADTQSAQPGFSEHQTGWAVDFMPTNQLFYDSPQAYWLEENAYRYGFIIRYTEENSDITLYIHEPWHVRYIGEEAARFMHDNSIGSLEEYCVKYVQHKPPASLLI